MSYANATSGVGFISGLLKGYNQRKANEKQYDLAVGREKRLADRFDLERQQYEDSGKARDMRLALLQEDLRLKPQRVELQRMEEERLLNDQKLREIAERNKIENAYYDDLAKVEVWTPAVKSKFKALADKLGIGFDEDIVKNPTAYQVKANKKAEAEAKRLLAKRQADFDLFKKKEDYRGLKSKFTKKMDYRTAYQTRGAELGHQNINGKTIYFTQLDDFAKAHNIPTGKLTQFKSAIATIGADPDLTIKEIIEKANKRVPGVNFTLDQTPPAETPKKYSNPADSILWG